MPKYSIGDYVLYGVNGSCEIVDIGTLSFAGPDKIYYSLKPVADSRSTVHVPVLKEENIIRKILLKKEVDKILKDVEKVKAAEVISNRENCDPIIKSGDLVLLASLIKMLREVRRENRKRHKGLNIQEERILTDAERVFFSELATVYELSMEEAVSTYTGIVE